MPLNSLQMIGLSWRDPEPLISEYLDVIAAADQLEAVRRAVLRFLLAEGDWGEFVVGFTSVGSQWLEAYAACATSHKHYARELDRCLAYQADLSAGFATYLRDLRQSTRRSIWNLRRRLATYGEMAFEHLQVEDIESGFAELNRLHRLRWNKPAFEGRRLQFHTALARSMAIKGELAFSRLRLGSRVVSVLYDLARELRSTTSRWGSIRNSAARYRSASSTSGWPWKRPRTRGLPPTIFWQARAAPTITSVS